MNGEVVRGYAFVLSFALGVWGICELILHWAIQSLIFVDVSNFSVVSMFPEIFSILQFVLFIGLIFKFFEKGSRLKHGAICFAIILIVIRLANHWRWGNLI